MRDQLLSVMAAAALAGSLSTTPAPAAPVVYTSFTRSIHTPQVFDLEVFVSELQVPPGLGGFDWTFEFDPAAFATFGDWPYVDSVPGLGYPFFALEPPSIPGAWRVAAVSLLSLDELLALQRPDMLLMKRSFQTLTADLPVPGSFRVSGEATDAFGNPLALTFVVPEPGTGTGAVLAMAALLTRLAIRHRRLRRSG